MKFKDFVKFLKECSKNPEVQLTLFFNAQNTNTEVTLLQPHNAKYCGQTQPDFLGSIRSG